MPKDRAIIPFVSSISTGFRSVAFVILALIAAPLPSAMAAAGIWNGSTSTDWNTAANWTGGIPSAGTATITNVPPNICTITADPSAKPTDIIIGNAANTTGRVDHRAGTVTMNVIGTAGNWLFDGAGNATGVGTYNLADTTGTGGALTGFAQGSGSLVIGKLWVGGRDNAAGTGTFNMNSSGTISAQSTGGFAGNVSFSSVIVGSFGGTGTFNMDSGTVNNASTTDIGFSTGNTQATHGTMNLGGGTFNSESDFRLGYAGSAAGTAVVNVQGGTLNVGSTAHRWLIVGQWDFENSTLTVSSGNVNLNSGTDIRMKTQNTSGSTNIVNLNGGAITAYSDNHVTPNGTGVVDLMNSGGALTLNTFNLNGGTLTIFGIVKTTSNGTRVFNFNGGTLKATAPNTTFFASAVATTANVRNGGAVIDSAGNNITIDQVLVHSAIAGDNATDGGLTKNGNGTLTLTAANTYNGATTVNGGALLINNTSSSGSVTVNSGATFGGTGNIANGVTLSSGASLSPGNNAVGNLTVGSLTLSSVVTNNFEFNGTTNDQVVVTVSGGLTINGGIFNLYQESTLVPFTAPGTYNLIQYAGAIGGTGLDSTWTTASATNPHIANPRPGLTYQFGTSGNWVTLTIVSTANNGVWTANSDGNWSLAGNWTGTGTMPPSAANDAATFGVGTAFRTVTLDVNETVGTVVFTNANSFAITNHTLTLDASGSGAAIAVTAGTSNAIQSAVALNDNLTAGVNSGKALTISGNIANTSGAKTITVNGAGTLGLSGNNTYGPASGAVGTTLSSGTLQAGSNNALGAGDLSVTAASTLQAAGNVALANKVAVGTGTTLSLDANGSSLTLNGVISGGGTVNHSTATGTVTLNGNNTYSGGTAQSAGTLNLNNAGALGSGALNISGGTIDNTSGATVTLNNNAQYWNGNFTFAGTTNLDLGTGAVTPNATRTVTVTSNNLTVGGIIGGGAVGLTKLGAGTLTLSGANTYTGATTVSGGTLSLIGNAAIPSTTSAFLIGTVSGTPAAVYQSGANTSVTAQPTGGAWNLGNTAGASGYYNLSAGTFTIQNGGEFDPGGNTGGAGTFGQFDMTGGTMTVGTSGTGATYFLPNRGAIGESSVVNISGGTVTINPTMTESATFGGFEINWAAGGQTNATTISGSAIFTSPSESVKLNQANNAANVCSLNLNGGLFQTLGLTAGHCASAVVSFNGGTMKAGSAANGNFMGNVALVNIYGGGATIDNNGKAITIAQGLTAPTGNGVSSIAVTSGGAGYVIPPQVMITGGGGSNATAYAQISGGAVTNIVVTCPGNNYSTTPTVSLSGGGFTSAATVGTITTAANTSGSLVFNGTASTILTGTNTYTGTTTVNGGTLQIVSDAQLGAVPASPAVNITLNGGALYNNNSSPILSTNRTISLTSSGGYIQAGFGTNIFTVNSLITGTGALGINWDGSTTVLNSTNNYQGDTTIGVAFGTYWNNVGANPTVRLGIDNALPYGATAGNLNFGTSGQNNTATLDLNGHNLQLNGLNSSVNAVINNTNAGSYTVTVGNNNASGSFGGVIKCSNSTLGLTKVGNGTLTLSGTNTYNGDTTISGGTLAVGSGGSISNSANIILAAGTTFDVNSVSFTLGAGQTLKGTGTISGPMTTAAASAIYPASAGTAGILAFNGNLDETVGGVTYFDINTNATTGNDQITVAGSLTLNSSDAIHISALRGSAALATNVDYVLFSAAGGASMASTPALIWDGTTPSNYHNYSIVQSGNDVVLRYTSTQPPIVSATAVPATLERNQATKITAIVTPGNGASITSVIVNMTPLGGSSTALLVQSNASNVYTNTFAVAPTVGASTNSLSVAATDNSSPALVGTYLINPVVVVLTNKVWNGAGPDALSDDNGNWTSGAAPGYIGDSLTFAGSLNLSPDLDQNYTVSGVAFETNASSFTITSSGSYPLTLNGGAVVNNSTNLQTISAAINLLAPQTINATNGDMLISGVISGNTSLTKVGNKTLTLTANNAYTALTTVQGGILAVDGATMGTITNNIEIAPNAGQVAALNVTNGTVNADRVIIGGISANNTSPGSGTLNQFGGTILSREWFSVGSGGTNGGTGVYNNSGGILNVAVQQMEVGNFVGASGTVNLSGSGAINIWNNNALTMGANNYASNSTFNQFGGTVTLYSDQGFSPGGTGVLYLGRAALLTNTFTYNLFGGTLTVPQIARNSGTGNFYFNGGTLQTAVDSTNFISNLSAAYVSTNGAIIDDGGHQVAIKQALLHDPAAASDAGLTKQNYGTVALSGQNTYMGNTVINAGTLKLVNSPVLHLSFDNVSGTNVINDGNGGSTLNGALYGSATVVSGGKFGNCLSISGANATSGSCRIANSVVPLTIGAGRNWTVAMWIKSSTAGGAYAYQGDGSWATGNTTLYMNPGSASAGTHAGGVRHSQGWETGTATVNDGNWHQVVLLCSGTNKTLYVDGTLDSLTTDQWSGNGTGGQFWIGGSADTGDGTANLNGLVDEVYVYDRTISPAEIQALYSNNAIPVLPPTTSVNIASGANLDVGGINQQIASLSGAGNVILGDNAGIVGNLTVGNASDSQLDGNISDSGASTLTKVGTGALILTGSSSYTGATIVSNGTLNVIGSLSSPVNVASGAKLMGLGNIYNSVTVNGNLAPGSNSIAGTLGIYGNLTIGSSGYCTFALSDTYNSGNDQISMGGGTLTNNNIGNVIHIKSLGAGHNLDTTADYVLINGIGSTAGFFSPTPVWDVQPNNYANFTVVVSGSQLVLHYSTVAGPVASMTLNPSTVSRNQSTLITVNATNGSSAVTSVTVDASAIGGSSTLTLFNSGANVWTNRIAPTAGTSPGVYLLTATVTDANSLTANAAANLTVTIANDIWMGAGANDLFDTNPNWINSAAPAANGDSLTFAGTTRLTPSMNNSYSVTSVTFSNNAGSFNIGTANGSVLTNSGGFINNSTNAQTLNVPVVLSAAQALNAAAGNLSVGQTVDNGGFLLTVSGASNTIVSGAISGAGGLTKAGNGVLTLSGNNSFSGAMTVSSGTANITGSVGPVGSSAVTIIGSAATNAILNIGGDVNQKNLFLGNASGAVGVVRQTAGTVTITNGGGDNLNVGNISGGYGYYKLSGGTVLCNGAAAGGENNTGTGFTGTGGNGIMEINGGFLNDIGWFVAARGTTTETGVLNILSGAMSYAGGGIVNCWGTGGQIGIVNVLGGIVTNSTDVGFNLNQSGNATNTGVLNLNGGVAQANGVGGASGRVNFNGGTLRASKANGTYITGGTVRIYSGGASIDNNGFAITIAQPLLAPTGNGVHGFQLISGGSGYIAPPIVIITNGVGDTTGAGATAIAQIDSAAGTVTNIIITCPGVNYTAAPGFQLIGGGATTPAVINGVAPTANSSGGLTSLGSGTTTLSGTNTYTGDTTVSAGTLDIVQAVIATNSTVNIASGAKLQLDFSTTNRVGALMLNGVSQPNGVYNAANTATYFAGTGSLIIGAATATNPTNITFSVSGNALALSWPVDHLGWILQAQTNSLSVGLGTNWFDVPGSGSITSTNVAIDPTAPTVFYRLRSP